MRIPTLVMRSETNPTSREVVAICGVQESESSCFQQLQVPHPQKHTFVSLSWIFVQLNGLFPLSSGEKVS